MAIYGYRSLALVFIGVGGWDLGVFYIVPMFPFISSYRIIYICLLFVAVLWAYGWFVSAFMQTCVQSILYTNKISFCLLFKLKPVVFFVLQTCVLYFLKFYIFLGFFFPPFLISCTFSLIFFFSFSISCTSSSLRRS